MCAALNMQKQKVNIFFSLQNDEKKKTLNVLNSIKLWKVPLVPTLLSTLCLFLSNEMSVCIDMLFVINSDQCQLQAPYRVFDSLVHCSVFKSGCPYNVHIMSTYTWLQ